MSKKIVYFNRFEEQCRRCSCYYENWDEADKRNLETDHECSLELATYLNEPCNDFDNCTEKYVSNIKLTKAGIDHFKKMLEETKQDGSTNLCPCWEILSNSAHDCLICEEAFPKINRPHNCPCNCGHYDKETILRFLEQIIGQSKE